MEGTGRATSGVSVKVCQLKIAVKGRARSPGYVPGPQVTSTGRYGRGCSRRALSSIRTSRFGEGVRLSVRGRADHSQDPVP